MRIYCFGGKFDMSFVLGKLKRPLKTTGHWRAAEALRNTFASLFSICDLFIFCGCHFYEWLRPQHIFLLIAIDVCLWKDINNILLTCFFLSLFLLSNRNRVRITFGYWRSRRTISCWCAERIRFGPCAICIWSTPPRIHLRPKNPDKPSSHTIRNIIRLQCMWVSNRLSVGHNYETLESPPVIRWTFAWFAFEKLFANIRFTKQKTFPTTE